MKPVGFDYVRPASLLEAVELLTQDPQAKIIAGGQTLGPMLNLRLAQPSLLVDVTRIPDMTVIADTGDAVAFGACVTHAAIEDGRAPDHWNGFLRSVAAGIAYRAIRTRGTIGGSIAHADPAADWVSCFLALGADVIVVGRDGPRTTPLRLFLRGALETALADGEIVTGVRLPKISKQARTGYAKICRKTGEFAEAIAAVVDDPQSGLRRCVIGATQGLPVVLEADSFPALDASTEAIKQRIASAGYAGDAYALTLHAVAVQRALCQAYSRRLAA